MRSGIVSSIGPRWLHYSINWTARTHRAHRTRFLHVSYWLFGGWLLELCWWFVVGGAVAGSVIVWWFVKASFVGLLACGALITSAANWWFDHRAERKARDQRKH